MNRNDKARSKALAKVASGMKINSAADDAASFSISSRMRVKIRALEQDAQNVQNGSSILRTAEGGIQGQIEILRTIREKVIDAANDHNTDEDRQTIQKELVHLYDEMESLAYQMDFNSKKPLLADKITRLHDDEHSEIDRTKLNLIRDATDEVLDNVYGPFAAFTEYDSTKFNVATSTGFIAAIPGKSAVWSADFSNYSDAADLNNVGINIGGRVFVFTDNMDNNYYGATKIQLGDTVESTLDNLKNFIGGNIDGTKITVATNSIAGAKHDGGTITESPGTVTKTFRGAGAGISGTTSGGVTNKTHDDDLPPAAKASLTVDLSGAAGNSGFKFNGYNFRIIDDGATTEGKVDVTLTKGQSASGSTGSFNFNFDGNTLTFTAKSDQFNNYSVDGSGYNYFVTTPLPDETTDYTAYTEFGGATTQESAATAYVPAVPATANLGIAGKSFDDFSQDYAGKILEVFGARYKFYDSSLAPKLEGLREEDFGTRENPLPQIDIDELRNSGQTLAAALSAKIGGTVEGGDLKFSIYADGRTINRIEETLRHYDVDFSNLNVKMPAGL